MTFEPTASEPSPDLPTSPVLPIDDLPSDPATLSFGAETADDAAALADEPNPPRDFDPPPQDAAASPPPLSPADAARDNARGGAWAMSEYYDGWVLLGADGKPVMRNDGSRVGFRFADAARLAEELAATPEDETAAGAGRKALAPLDSGFNRDWDPQRPKSTLADMTKWTRLVAYHFVQTTAPEEAVRRAVSMIFGNPVTLDERGTKLWVPTKYDAEAVKSVANMLLQRVSGPGTRPVSRKEVAQEHQQSGPETDVRENIRDMDRLSFRDALDHYAKGNGQPIRIPLSSLDLSNVSASQFGAKKKIAVTLPGEDRYTIGTIELELDGPETVRAHKGYDDYDFDIKFEEGSGGRDVATALGYLLNEGNALWENRRIEQGPLGVSIPMTKGGKSYKIYLEGTAKIKP